MKYLFLSILMVISSIGNAQESPYKYWKLENKSVTFDAIYNVPELSERDLREKLLTFVASVKGLQEIRENSTGITAVMSTYECDYRKAGYSRISAPIFLVHKLSGHVSILIKEGKYRVIITNVMSNKTDDLIEKRELFTNSEIENVILKLNKSGWATAKNKIDMNKLLEEDFYQSFKLKETKSDW